MRCSMLVRGWPIALCAFLGLGVPCGARAESTNTPPVLAPRKPSIVLIVADGLGYGDLGCYGQERIHTPVLDQLARKGVRFTDFHAASPEAEPASAALLTGSCLHPGLVSDVPTLAEQLKAAGYHTAYIGVWWLGRFDSENAAHRRGFAETVVYGSPAHARDLYTGHLFRKDVYTGFEDRESLVGNSGGKRQVFLPELLTRAAVKFCKQSRPEALNNFRPFLLVLSYPLPAAAASAPGDIPSCGSYAQSSWSAVNKARADAITLLDAYIGEIVKQLEDQGTAQNTIVLVTGTQGPRAGQGSPEQFFQSLGPFSSDAGALSEGRLRIPLIGLWPFWAETGRTAPQLTAAQDVVPTLLEAAQLEVPDTLSGVSFLPLLQARAQTNQHACLRWSVVREEEVEQRSVREGQWKLIQPSDDKPPQLYDLSVSPAENQDLAKDRPEVVARLEELMTAAPAPEPGQKQMAP